MKKVSILAIGIGCLSQLVGYTSISPTVNSVTITQNLDGALPLRDNTPYLHEKSGFLDMDFQQVRNVGYNRIRSIDLNFVDKYILWSLPAIIYGRNLSQH
jgi:hypothetical protein